MTKEEAREHLRTIGEYYSTDHSDPNEEYEILTKDELDAINLAIKALEQEPKKGEWLRMSDLSEQEDDRYQCSRCGNVVHHKNKMNLYTFNSWCGRCGSDNGRHINYEVEE